MDVPPAAELVGWSSAAGNPRTWALNLETFNLKTLKPARVLNPEGGLPLTPDSSSSLHHQSTSPSNSSSHARCVSVQWNLHGPVVSLSTHRLALAPGHSSSSSSSSSAARSSCRPMSVYMCEHVIHLSMYSNICACACHMQHVYMYVCVRVFVHGCVCSFVHVCTSTEFITLPSHMQPLAGLSVTAVSTLNKEL